MYDYLIVGSGLAGATFAHQATRDGYRCLVIDRRKHLGGNIHCDIIDGITVHSYGPHIFHTHDRRIWDFVSGLTTITPFINTPLARYKGTLYNLPFNMHTFHQIWGVSAPDFAERIIKSQRRMAAAKRQGAAPRNLEEQALDLVGHDIYERLIKGYTMKQWGKLCTELPADIIKRIPVRFTYDNNYFNDPYQGIADYNALTAALLEGCDTLTDTDFFDSDYRDWKRHARHLVYTGPIDQYFDYSEGRLEWRSLRFATRSLPTANHQGVAIINDTNADVAYTRTIEHKHFLLAAHPELMNIQRTIVTHEYPVPATVDVASATEHNEPYYPIATERNNALADRYRALAAALAPDVTFIGRLAEYRYYDMDDAIAAALARYEEQVYQRKNQR